MACTMSDKMATVEVETPVKQCITVLDKKVRNLEKRKLKLEAYKKSGETEELNKDQKEAIAKYELVQQNIDFAKELQKQFMEISADTDKQAKKQAKREKIERHQQEMLRLQELLKLQNLLNALGIDTVREDFKSGKNTTLVLTNDNLKQLDDFYQVIVPNREEEISFSDQLTSASEHLMCYLDYQDKKVLNTSYKELHQLIDRIRSCGYFEKDAKSQLEVIKSTSENQLSGATAAAAAAAAASDSTDLYEDEQAADEAIDSQTEMRSDLNDDINNSCIASSQMMTVENSHQSHVSLSQSDSYHPPPSQPTNWSHASVLQQTAAVSPSVSATTVRIAMTTASSGDRMGGFIEGAYYGGFVAKQQQQQQQQQQQRPLKEIVSSLQGSYNFLQESQIDTEAGHIQTHAMSEGGPFNSYDNQNNSGLAPAAIVSYANQQQQVIGSQSATIHSSQHHFDHDPSTSAPPGGQIPYHQQGPTPYGVPGLHHNVYGHHQVVHETRFDQNYGQMEKSQFTFMEQKPTFVLAHMNPAGGSDSSHTANIMPSGPQPIPLPSQALHGQSLTEQGYGLSQTAAEVSDALVKKQFQMNPNADIFRSVVYDEPSPADQLKTDLAGQATGAGDGQVTRTFAQTASANYQGSGAGSVSFGSVPAMRGSAGVNRGGHGVGSNGRSPALNNGNIQRGGKGGGGGGGMTNSGSNGQRGGGNVRGGPSRGGNSGGTRGGASGGRGFARINSQQSGQEQQARA